MDLAKRGRNKVCVSVGDCVSISSSYFGADYVKELGLEVVYGRIVEIVNGNRDFNVKWDIDRLTSKGMNLEKVTLEKRDTPTQVIASSIITEDDFQTADQGTSREASETHALIVEEFDSVTDDKVYFLLSDNVKCFV